MTAWHHRWPHKHAIRAEGWLCYIDHCPMDGIVHSHSLPVVQHFVARLSTLNVSQASLTRKSRVLYQWNDCCYHLLRSTSTHAPGPLNAEFPTRLHAQLKVAFSTAYTPPPSTASFPSADAPVQETLPAPFLYRNPPKSALFETNVPPVILRGQNRRRRGGIKRDETLCFRKSNPRADAATKNELVRKTGPGQAVESAINRYQNSDPPSDLHPLAQKSPLRCSRRRCRKTRLLPPSAPLPKTRTPRLRPLPGFPRTPHLKQISYPPLARIVPLLEPHPLPRQRSSGSFPPGW